MGKKTAKNRKTAAAAEEKTTVVTASPQENLAHIQALQNSIQCRIHHINRPAAMAVTAITIPTIASLLFIYKWSPFYTFYHQEYEQAMSNHYSEDFKQQLHEKVVVPYIEPIKRSINGVRTFCENAIMTIKADPHFKNLNPTIKDILSYMDEPQSGWAEAADALKDKLINHYNGQFLKINHDGRDIAVNKPLNKAAKWLVKDLYDEWNRAANKFIETGLQLVYSQGSDLAQSVSKEMVKCFTLKNKIILSVLAQYLLIEPYLMPKIFPHGVFQQPPPRLQLFSTEEKNMQRYRERLEQHDQALAIVEKRNIFYARMGIGATVVGGSLGFFDFYYLIRMLSLDGLLPLDIVMLFFVGLLATGSIGLINEATDYYNHREFKNQLESQKNKLERILADHTISVIEKHSLETSCFLVQFESLDAISSKRVAILFKNILFKSLKTLSLKKSIGFYKNVFLTGKSSSSLRSEDNLIISAGHYLDEENLKILFKEAIAREKSFIFLKKQISELLKACFLDETAFVFIPGIDSAGLPIVTVEFNLPLFFNTFISKFENIFGENNTNCEFRNNFLNITIRGFFKLDEAKLCDLYNQLNAKAIEEHHKDHKQADYKGVETENVNENAAPTRQRILQASLQQVKSSPDVKAAPVTSPRIVYWKNVVYHSNDKDSKVYPLNIGQFHQFKAIANAKHFIRNGLDISVLEEGLARAIESQVSAPKLVMGKGKQGFIFSESQENDQNGKEFTTSMKLKLLGVFGKGNTRGFTKAEKSSSGEVLHTLIGLDFNAHN